MMTDDVLDRLKEQAKGFRYGDFTRSELAEQWRDLLLAAISEIEALRNSWVSVGERLPDPHPLEGERSDFVLVDQGRAYYNFRNRYWYTVTDWPIAWEVTHWMPLPPLHPNR